MHQAYPQKDAQGYSLQNWRVYSAYFSPPTHEAKVTCAFKSSPQISRLAVREQTLPPCKAVQLYITSRESVCLHVNDWSQDQNKCRITFRKHLKIYKNGIHVFKNLFPTLCFQKVLQQFIINFRKFKKNVHMYVSKATVCTFNKFKLHRCHGRSSGNLQYSMSQCENHVRTSVLHRWGTRREACM